MIWQLADVMDQPSVQLYNWTIKKMKEGEFFVGDEVRAAGRVSTKIFIYDEARKVGRTASGRVYQLIGEEGYSSNGEYVWEQYKRINNLTEL